jgi:hypothetical protein
LTSLPWQQRRQGAASENKSTDHVDQLTFPASHQIAMNHATGGTREALLTSTDIAKYFYAMVSMTVMGLWAWIQCCSLF